MNSFLGSLLPFPSKVKYVKNEENIGCYFSYKKYVDIKKVCDNLLKHNDKKIYDALSTYSQNHYNHRDILYYNLQDVSPSILIGEYLSGYYLLSRELNEIAFISFEDCYHEPLHMSSTVFDKGKEITYSGFSYQVKDFNSVGEGITDGYIELLVDRDLYDGKFIRDYDINTKSKGGHYIYNNVLARELEIIVGRELLEDMFFNDGFYRLKEFLMKYKSEKEVMMFFHNSDCTSMASIHQNKLLNKKVLAAQDFLFSVANAMGKDCIEELEYEKLSFVKNDGRNLINQRMKDDIDEIKSNNHKK